LPALKLTTRLGPPWGGDYGGVQTVVVDVLRATSTLPAALANGALFVVARAVAEEAFAERAALERDGVAAILGGERGGNKLPGFDAGNSPLEYEPARVAGKAVVLCTTNGSGALEACARAAALFAASFLNAGATVKRLVRSAAPVAVVCAGKEGAPALEDIACAGLLVERLTAVQPYDADDAGEAARLVWKAHRRDVAALLANCRHGRYLAALGYERDLAYCARVDALDVVVTRDAAGRLVKG
jgi:2-phosphosulfolactate phosphatase